MSSVIQVPASSARGAAHCLMTSAKAWSSVMRYWPLLKRLLVRREICISLGNMTQRGAGFHHSMGWFSEYQGKMPWR